MEFIRGFDDLPIVKESLEGQHYHKLITINEFLFG